MKSTRIIIAALAACILGGCTSTIATVSPTHFDNAVQRVNQRMEEMGYGLSGKLSEELNEIYVTNAIVDPETGIGSEMRNDYYWYDTYHFTDSTGNTASYLVKYQLNSDRKSAPYIHKISVVGCECSNSGDYARICGDGGAVQAIGMIFPDQNSTIRNTDATFWWITGTLFGTLALGLILLMQG